MRAFQKTSHSGAYIFTALAAMALPQSLGAADVSIPFNPANFSNPLNINNPLFPLVAGRTYFYHGDGPDGCEETRTAITSQTKLIAGVTARVVHDAVYVGKTCRGPFKLEEDTFDWYAQDNSGNVWYLGEDSKDCDGNKCVQNAGSWQTGVNGAQAGLIMLAHPHQGDHYRQEYYAGHAEDEAAVVDVNAAVMLARPDAIQPRLYYHCLKTRESTRLEPGTNAYKFYCPNVGLVMEDEKDIHTELVAIR